MVSFVLKDFSNQITFGLLSLYTIKSRLIKNLAIYIIVKKKKFPNYLLLIVFRVREKKLLQQHLSFAEPQPHPLDPIYYNGHSHFLSVRDGDWLEVLEDSRMVNSDSMHKLHLFVGLEKN
jgi:hypothetical protein